MIKVKKHTEGDSRVAKELPSIKDFDTANRDHIADVVNLVSEFSKILKQQVVNHDFTKVFEPYRSMFYRDLCNTIDGKMNFMDGEWAKIHYYEKERHHLKEHSPDDVNLFDVIEMICDCVVASKARGGKCEVDIPTDLLVNAVQNTVSLLEDRVEVIE